MAPRSTRTDVYGLGAMLYELLAGVPPHSGTDARDVIDRVASGVLAPIPDDPRLPAELVRACERAMSARPEDRFPSASELAGEIQAWLDGARLREQALAVVEVAVARGPAAERLREQAAALEAEAAALLAPIAPWEPEEVKAPAWARQDVAAALRRRADLEEREVAQGLDGALRIDAGLPEAHAALAERALAEHRDAERRRDLEGSTWAEARIDAHARALPDGHAVRARCAAYLQADGALTLWTDPPGAEVALYRYVERNRRLVPEPVRELGRTPLVAVSLPMGSYLCRIGHPDRLPVDYPVHIGRREHQDGVPPGGTQPLPVYLPRAGELGTDDCYVPAGWFLSGGDPDVLHPLPLARRWVDAFAIQRFPVTNEDYIAFLDDLVARGREADALAWAPRERGGPQRDDGGILYGRDASGRFVRVPDADGDMWSPRWPVIQVTAACAVGYARWHAARSGLPWRLPGEMEREKAARGVDARAHPWGDWTDPSWGNMRDSQAGRASPADVDAFPVDVSVYGVRGMGGNVRDWCADVWSPEPDAAPCLPVPSLDEVEATLDARRVIRGGVWIGFARSARCASRWEVMSTNRYSDLGIRLARPLGRGSGRHGPK